MGIRIRPEMRGRNVGREVRRQERGFSLIELLIMGLLVVVLASMAVPRFMETMDSYRLTSCANTIAGELDTARMIAISRGAEIQVTFVGNSIRIVDLDDPTTLVRAPRQLEKDVSFSATPATPIVFYPRGTARGGVVSLQNGDGDQLSIQVLVSGRIKVS